VNYSVGPSPFAVAVGDVNGDGRPDLVTVNNADSTVSVLLGNGDGTFQAAKTSATGPGPRSVAVGDFTGDGKLDLVTANAGDLSLLPGNGDGTFRPPEYAAAGPGTWAVAAADFNGDHFPDLAVANFGSGTVSVLLNTTDWRSIVVSGFPSPTTAGVAGTFTVTVKGADGSTLTGYTGTVAFSSSDGQAALPGPYTFTAADAGVHTFTATLKTAGTQSLTATDTAAGLTSTQAGITVSPAAAARFLISGPTSVRAHTSFSITVTVVDAYGNVVTNYRGTVRFKSTEQGATLPANYTFTAADRGVHTFSGLTFKKRGKHTITVYDLLNTSRVSVF
jgi:hypothetical protein